MPRRPPIRMVCIALLVLPAELTAGVPPLAPQPAPQPAQAQAPGTPVAVSRAQAEELLAVLDDPVRRAQFASLLQALLRTLPATNAGSPAAAPAKPATPAITFTHDSVIAQVPGEFLLGLRAAAMRFAAGFRAVTDLPVLVAWMRTMFADPARRAALAAGLARLGAIAVVGLLVEWLVRRALRSARPPSAGNDEPAAEAEREIREATAQRSLRPRILGASLHFLRALAPTAAVGLVGNLLVVWLLDGFPSARPVAFGVLNAYVAVRVIMNAATTLLRPDAAGARLLPLGTLAARRTLRFLRAVVVIAAFGFIGGEVAANLGVSTTIYESIQKLVALCIHVFLVVAVIRSRRVVAGWIRGVGGGRGPLAALCQALAAVWPYVAVIAIAAWWLIWAWGIPGAYLRILRFVLVTAGILLASRLLGDFLRHALDRILTAREGAESASAPRRMSAYAPLLQGAVRAALGVATLLALTAAWGLPVATWFAPGHPGERVGALALKLVLLIALTILCWEAANAAVERHVARLTRESAIQRASRVRTLQPIVRIALIATLGVVMIMTALSEIGINIGPLLAGASIFGVALGFGSQKLVQDFITGIFLLVEDAMDVGDWVTVAGVSGTVEHLSIRTIRLRDGDGAVHLIPFSAVTSVTNTSRGVGNVPISVAVAPTEDSDRVAAVLEELARGMRADPAFGAAMRGDLELWGVDKIDGTALTIAGQIVCTDSGRWPVQREFNRRLKRRFAELGIHFAVPRQSVRIEQRPAPADRVDADREKDDDRAGHPPAQH